MSPRGLKKAVPVDCKMDSLSRTFTQNLFETEAILFDIARATGLR